ncbi:TonB family protein [Aestuariicella sp. G3-2]|uniref:energy transducer TonB n=1 Tax=Pseudomaricurvus albidus TaxID=2842452 RepID=UPI001C0E4C59|nr:energy transducer TonB [Aestuariicella albida]MBU3068471.1 TonB family protein [Aestuariicella albida]
MSDSSTPVINAPLNTAAVDTGDRLSFTVFLALALHALLILGISFQSDIGGKPTPTLDITLATHTSNQAPDKADFLAQANQEASGTGEEARQMTTDQLAPINDTRIQEINPTPQVRAVTPTQKDKLQPVVTQNSSSFKVQQKETAPDQEDQEKQEGKDAQDTPLSAEIASLKAKLDRQRQAIAKRPRIRRITSVATKASADAAYLNDWVRKIEFVGNRNFPEEAVQQRIFGQLRLATILRPNGTILSVEILQSSGHNILDNAALQIVHMAAPFAPFPTEIRKNADQLEIIRTWHFELNGLATSSSRQ